MSLTDTCSHCGRDIAPADAPAFCCSGCASVYAILGSCGLGQYYALRAELDPVRARDPQTSSVADDRGFDDPAVLAIHGFVAGAVVLRLGGLHCAACIWLLERLPQALPGVTHARVDFGAATLTLRWDPEQVKLSEVARFLRDAGYDAHLAAADAQRASRTANRKALWRIGVTGALAGNTMLASFAVYAGELSTMPPEFRRMFDLLALVFAIPAVTWGAWPFYAGALAGLRARVLHMDLPIALGIITGFVASTVAVFVGAGESYFDTVTTLVFLLLVGRRIQLWGQGHLRARSELMSTLVPPVAMRRQGDDWVGVPADALVAGDVARVESGARFPADGEVERGAGHMDASVLTGESRPEPLAVGSRVWAGATNVGDPIEIVVAHAGATSRVGGIVSRITADDARPAAIVRLADRIAGWFVATVLLLAVVGGFYWWPHSPRTAIDVVVALLVVSCPCALGLATPMAVAIARGRAARAGIMLRSGAALEAIARVPTVVLDKTGTLTEGRLDVLASSVPASAHAAIAALERTSRHPIARAIASALGKGVTLRATDVVEHPGSGIEGTVGEHHLRIGSASWLGAEARQDVRAALARVHTPVVVEIDGVVVGTIAVADRVRPEAVELVRRLVAAGKRVVIASGDHAAIVRAVADELGVADARGGCSPEAKAALVEELAPAAMIGDGINDALAMRRATVAIAVRGGVDAALAVADVYLGNDDLGLVARLFEGARRTLGVIVRNLGFSLVYNVVFAALALMGAITPLVAAILMPTSSLTVLASSLLARTFVDDARTQTLRAGSPAFALAEPPAQRQNTPARPTAANPR